MKPPQPAQSEAEFNYTPCGGCGATKPSDRCIGCFHQFGEPPLAPVAQQETVVTELADGATLTRTDDAGLSTPAFTKSGAHAEIRRLISTLPESERERYLKHAIQEPTPPESRPMTADEAEATENFVDSLFSEQGAREWECMTNGKDLVDWPHSKPHKDKSWVPIRVREVTGGGCKHLEPTKDELIALGALPGFYGREAHRPGLMRDMVLHAMRGTKPLPQPPAQ